MFEAEKLEVEVEGMKIIVDELDYIQESEYTELYFRMKENDKEIEALTKTHKKAIDAAVKSNKDMPTEFSVEASKINTKNKNLLLEALSIPAINVDGVELKKKDMRMFLKKLGQISAMTLFFQIMAIGKVQEEDEGK